MTTSLLEPIRATDWNPDMAAHLLNRAGFGANPETVAIFAAMTPEQAVRRLVNGPDRREAWEDLPPPEWTNDPEADLRAPPGLRVLPPEEQAAARQEFRRLQLDRLESLQHWWLNRMRHSHHPLQEKMTLFWHGHFATSAEKVRNAYALYAQNRMFRELGLGSFRELVVAVARDPAMLVYLDNALSEKESPNENFARELMELFTLGEGQYSEADIREAARAFTGWSLEAERMAFVFRALRHDEERKTFMHLTGNLDGEDIIDEIVEHPACPVFIASKLWRFFVADEIDPAWAEELGEQFYRGGGEIAPFLTRLFLSRAFYQKTHAHAQIKSPVQWLVHACIALEGPVPDARTCSQLMRTLGQELFRPPNVKGWDGGAAWITAATLMQRYNAAGYLLKGSDNMKPDRSRKRKREEAKKAESGAETAPVPEGGLDRMEPIVSLDLAIPKAKRKTLDDAYDYLEWRFYQRRLGDKEKFAIRVYLTKKPTTALMSDDELRNFLHVMMSTPYFQVC